MSPRRESVSSGASAATRPGGTTPAPRAGAPAGGRSGRLRARVRETHGVLNEGHGDGGDLDARDVSAVKAREKVVQRAGERGCHGREWLRIIYWRVLAAEDQALDAVESRWK